MAVTAGIHWIGSKGRQGIVLCGECGEFAAGPSYQGEGADRSAVKEAWAAAEKHRGEHAEGDGDGLDSELSPALKWPRQPYKPEDWQ